MASLSRIELPHQPASRRFRDLAGRNQEQVVQQDITVRLGVKDRMIDCHARLIEHARYVLCPARVVRVYLVLLDLGAKVDPVAGRELEFHPQIFPEFQRFVLMPCRTDTPEAEALKKWNKNLFNEFVLAGSIEERRQLLSLLDLRLGERAGRL